MTSRLKDNCRVGAALAVTALLALLINGCAGYRPLAHAAPVTLRIPPIVNEANIPSLIVPLQRELRAAIANTRGYAITDQDFAADAQLIITLSDISQRSMGRDAADTGRPVSFLQTIEVRLDWHGDLPSPWGGPTTVVAVDMPLHPVPSLADARAALTPQLARDLAAAIIARIAYPQAFP
jgi:hypothetical protein